MSFQPFVSRWYLAMPSTIAGRLRGRVARRRDRVVHEGDLHLAEARRLARARPASPPQAERGMIAGGAPRPPGDLGRARQRAPAASAGAASPTATKCSAQRPVDRGRGAQLQLVGAAGPDRVRRAAGLAAAHDVGRVVAVGVQRRPRAPRPAARGACAPRRPARAPRTPTRSKRRGARRTGLGAPAAGSCAPARSSPKPDGSRRPLRRKRAAPRRLRTPDRGARPDRRRRRGSGRAGE